MSLHVILGITIHSPTMIRTLKSSGNNIMVLDHDHVGDEELVNDVTYLSPDQAKGYINQSENVVFHKFMNRGPRRNG